MKMLKFAILFAAIVLIGVTAEAQVKLPHKNYKLFHIQVPGATSTTVSGLNDLGDMVGNYTDTYGRVHSWLLRKGHFSEFTFSYNGTPADYVSLSAINNDGWVTGASNFFPDCGGFKYNLKTGETVCISYLSPGGGYVNVVPAAINNRGAVAGSYWVTSNVGFTFDSTGFHSMENIFLAMNPLEMYVKGISDAGLTVGFTRDAAGKVCGENGFVANPDHSFHWYQIGSDCLSLNGISTSGKWMIGRHFDNLTKLGSVFVTYRNEKYDVTDGFSPTGINSYGLAVGYTWLNGKLTGVVALPRS